jgi:hypothetical protein
MDKAQRIAVIRAMELLARQVNDEELFEEWLVYGVADGDIDENTTDAELEYYTDDDTFAELMGTFTNLMRKAHKNGGLYCDRVVSR